MDKPQTTEDRKINPLETTLYFNTRDELVKVRLDKVSYFEADSNYCHVHFVNGAKATMLTSLVGIENLIKSQISVPAAHPFIRIGKKYIVNQKYIFQINIPRQRIVLTDFESPVIHEIAVSKEALKKLKQLYRKS